jgi:hypothetical protein
VSGKEAPGCRASPPWTPRKQNECRGRDGQITGGGGRCTAARGPLPSVSCPHRQTPSMMGSPEAANAWRISAPAQPLSLQVHPSGLAGLTTIRKRRTLHMRYHQEPTTSTLAAPFHSSSWAPLCPQSPPDGQSPPPPPALLQVAPVGSFTIICSCRSSSW